MPELTHALLSKELTKNLPSFGRRKTNPKRTQTKPNSKMTKINAKPLIQRDYEQKMVISPQKNEAKTNPISKNAKNEHKPCLQKGLRKFIPLGSPKKRTQIKPNFPGPAQMCY
jgi:hypothetical protein